MYLCMYIFIEILHDHALMWKDTMDNDDPDTSEHTIRQGGLTPAKVNQKLLFDIQSVLSRLVGKAPQLLGNTTTNLAECWMHIRTKFDGGEVINRSQSGSWQYRCMGAGLRQNLGRTWGPEAWKQATNTSPNKVYSNVAQNSAKIVDKDRKRKATEEAKVSRRRSKYQRTDDTIAARKAYSRHDSGMTPDDVADISSDHLKQLLDGFYSTKVAVNSDEAKQIEEKTRNQANDEYWIAERRLRITASKVGGIAKMRNKTRRSNKVKELLYTGFKGNAATAYGSMKEEETMQLYIAHQRRNGHPNLTVQRCGLFVSPSSPWLAASPDGLVTDPSANDKIGLLEMKNPFSARDKTLSEACSNSSFCLEEKNCKYLLKERHDYYYQIQCQLHCADKSWCDFVVRTKDIYIERIYRNSRWWESHLVKLRTFYFTALLPELACPRHTNGGIREPE